MRYLYQLLQFRLPQPRSAIRWQEWLHAVAQRTNRTLSYIGSIGMEDGIEGRAKTKLGIFNHLNVFQLATGILVPLIGFLYTSEIPARGWVITSLPAMVSVIVLLLNVNRKYDVALLVYFTFYPIFTCVSYINGISLGVELTFILYGILAVFFIRDIGYMVFAIGFSMISYFILAVVLKSYRYELATVNYPLYLVNQGLAILYIFYGLYLIKTENAIYNNVLQNNNVEIQQQAKELESLNSLKNNLFSVISHDLKSPLYALRNLFEHIQQQDMPAEEIKEMVPDIKNDLNYTVGLMENLLQWAKSQMKAHIVRPQELEVDKLIHDVLKPMHLQAEQKSITLENLADPLLAWADRDMICLVVRNIVSNAIKFTPKGGKVTIKTESFEFFVKVMITDTGKGMEQAEIRKINAENFYTTTGTAQEQGTGLGLMLCKEFLQKNDGKLYIESKAGKGSTFSFTLPKA